MAQENGKLNGSDVLFRVVPLGLVGQTWPHVSGWAEKAMNHHPCMTGRELYALLMNGRAMLVVAIEGEEFVGALIVELLTFPTERALNIICACGKSGKWSAWGAKSLQYIEHIAAGLGCKHITGLGRRGWSKEAQKLGWTATPYLLLSKEVSYVQGRWEPNHDQHGKSVGAGSASSARCH